MSQPDPRLCMTAAQEGQSLFSGFIYLYWLESEIFPMGRGPRLRYAAGWMAGFGMRLRSAG